MKRFLLAAAILAIAVAILVSLTIQPAQLILQSPRPDGAVPGVLHIHTSRSDGRGTIDEIAAAAARAGLRFVVITDHGDATTPPEPAAYRNGVLCIDAVEISTAGGHVVALDMAAAPYPLAGEPRDVVEDIHRLGGFAIAAHPDSPKKDLRWRDWDVPVDGVETLNLDSGWRAWADWAGWAAQGDSMPPLPGQPDQWRSRGRLATALLDYPFRPAQTIAGLIPPSGTEAYDKLAEQRRVVSMAGADAHSKIAFRGDAAEGGSSLPIPGYEPTFRVMSVRVKTSSPLTGNASDDTRLLMSAIREGRLYTALDAVATPPAIEFSAESDAGRAMEGEELPAGAPVTFHVQSNMPSDFTAMIRRGATVVGGGHDQDFTVRASGDPGAYTLTIDSGRPETLGAVWIRTNPIYLRAAASGQPSPAPAAAPASVTALFDRKSAADWGIEHDPDSQGAVDVANLVEEPALRFRYGLAGGTVAAPFVALVHDTPAGTAPADRVAFTIRAEQPMRVSLQVRVPPDATFPSERWQRSLYVDATPREYSVRMDDLTPVGVTHTPMPPYSDVRSLIFVLDTINTRPGASGRIWLSKVRFER